MARELLEGFGEPQLGEWSEDRPLAFHIRRRLSLKEQERVGNAIDCRSSDEGRKRLERIAGELPAQALYLAAQELAPSLTTEQEQG